MMYVALVWTGEEGYGCEYTCSGAQQCGTESEYSLPSLSHVYNIDQGASLFQACFKVYQLVKHLRSPSRTQYVV